METIKLKISLKKFNSNMIGFYDYIVHERSDPDSQIGNYVTIPDANELFQVIENEFDELHKQPTLIGMLRILHLTVQQKSTLVSNIANLMKDLLTKHSSNEKDHIIASQIVYQVLSSLPNNIDIEELRTSGFIEEVLNSDYGESSKLDTQLALCTSLLIDRFQMDSLLEITWQQILANKSYHLLVHFMDKFLSKTYIYERVSFWQIIETLISGETRDDRKLGMFLIKKILKYLSTSSLDIEVDKLFYWTKNTSNQLMTSWSTYLTIMQNLEEKQSHLILPSLAMLANLTLGNETPWIRIVLLQMLQHNNKLVLRWSVDYLLRNFVGLVLANQIMHEFLNASNNTWLYNETEASTFKLPTFSTSDQSRFLDVFAKVHWKSVPMHAWLLRMRTVQWSGIESNLIITLATRLRQLQNRFIRSDCRDIFTSIFKPNIDDMTFLDFINFLEALYSSTDRLSKPLLCTLVQKIETDSHPIISSHVCAILRGQRLHPKHESILMHAFDEVKVEDHRWFRVLVRFGFDPTIQQVEFCKKHYNVQPDIANLSLGEALSVNVSKLSWDDMSKAVVREATVDWLTSTAKDINQSDFELFLDSGGVRTLTNIANPGCRHFPLDHELLDRLVAELRIAIKKMMDTDLLVSHLIFSCAKDQPQLLYKYVNKILDLDVTNNRLALNVYKSVVNACDCHEAEGRKLLIRGLLFGEPLNGDLRLEHDYAVRMTLSQELKHDSTYDVRQTCLRCLQRLDSESIHFLKADLIAQSEEMSIKKPRYFENSKHHRLKLRIAQALAVLNQISSSWNNYYLTPILRENNQTNVTYVYEFIIARTISKSELFKHLENLKDLSISCQVSMFAISYLFTMYYPSSNEFVRELIALLLPWTMGANFNTRLYAQITICCLLKKFVIESFDFLKVPLDENLRKSPTAYEKLASDLRYNFPSELNYLDTDAVLYVTVVPEDEHSSSQLEYLSKFESLRVERSRNLSKREAVKEDETEIIIQPIIEDVQRKMNPEMMDQTETHKSVSKVKNLDMIVLASLIDKLPNLGGIARTCEVLGIKNLVLDSISHAHHKEFQNLSMTAENWIRIYEVKPAGLRQYLIDKKSEGYEIVGAEQTAKSVKFTEFKFPRKCVLLLGHEKEGIPADLIAFLDYAVEIPQYGMVRSLNVHVTGALFMYEYCKQHLSSQEVD